MSVDQWILAGVFVGAVALMLFTRLRPDLIAILASLSLGLTGVIAEAKVFSGLSSSVVITLISLFIIARALEDTGVIRWIAVRMSRVGGKGETRVMFTLMSSAALLSLGMNNVAVGALLLPASIRVSRASGVPVSRLLMPISFGTLLGGMATYFTTANIIMSDLLLQRGLRGLRMPTFLLTGGIVAVVGLVFMLVVGRHFLPRRKPNNGGDDDFFDLYRIGERFWELTVKPGSSLAGKSVEQSAIGSQLGLVILAIDRGRRTIVTPGPAEAILAGDRLLVVGREERAQALTELDVTVRQVTSETDFRSHLELAEIIVPPRSNVIDKTLSDLELRSRHGVTAVALWRGGRVIRTDVGTIPLQVGDALLVVNVLPRLVALARGGNWLLAGTSTSAPPRPERAIMALAIFAGVVASAVTGLLPMSETALTGAVAMILTGCVSMDDAYRSVEWQVIFLVAGMLPLGFAMVDTGLAGLMADGIAKVAGQGSGLWVITLVFVVTAIATQVVGGQVSALIVGPVALEVANVVGIAPHPMALAVAISASAAFLTPMAHPVNAMTMGTAGYVPRDFLRVGVGMMGVTLLGLLGAMWLVWGIR